MHDPKLSFFLIGFICFLGAAVLTIWRGHKEPLRIERQLGRRRLLRTAILFTILGILFIWISTRLDENVPKEKTVKKQKVESTAKLFLF